MKIKNCPFCGAAGKLKNITAPPSDSRSGQVVGVGYTCSNNKCEASHFLFTDWNRRNEVAQNEIKQLHLTIARLTEAHQKEMKEEIGKQQRYLDRLAEKVEHYTAIIEVHKELSK